MITAGMTDKEDRVFGLRVTINMHCLSNEIHVFTFEDF